MFPPGELQSVIIVWLSVDRFKIWLRDGGDHRNRSDALSVRVRVNNSTGSSLLDVETMRAQPAFHSLSSAEAGLTMMMMMMKE